MSDVIGSKGTGGAEARCESEGGVWGVLARETSSPYLHAVSRFIHPEHEGFCSSHWHAHQNRGLGLASLSYGNTRMATYFDSSFLALNASISRLFVSPSRRHEDVGGSYMYTVAGGNEYEYYETREVARFRSTLVYV